MNMYRELPLSPHAIFGSVFVKILLSISLLTSCAHKYIQELANVADQLSILSACVRKV